MSNTNETAINPFTEEQSFVVNIIYLPALFSNIPDDNIKKMIFGFIHSLKTDQINNRNLYQFEFILFESIYPYYHLIDKIIISNYDINKKSLSSFVEFNENDDLSIIVNAIISYMKIFKNMQNIQNCANALSFINFLKYHDKKYDVSKIKQFFYQNLNQNELNVLSILLKNWEHIIENNNYLTFQKLNLSISSVLCLLVKINNNINFFKTLIIKI